MNLLFNRKKPDPAARYPAPMAELLRLGNARGNVDYPAYAADLADYTDDLIRMVLDEELANRKKNDPAVWAPFHALEILAVLGPAEAAEPLLACLEWDTDWLNDELSRAYAAIGPVAIPLLLAYLEDAAHDAMTRALASDALKAIAEAHPAARAEVIEALTRFLDRSSADGSVGEETVTSFVISDLTDLGATSAYDAIARAFHENRVDTQILDLESVEQEFGMRPKPNYAGDESLAQREEPGVHLTLKCKVCGRERTHVFPTVYYDVPTARNEKKFKKYDPLVIPQRVVCPKCGAVDQYELSGMGHVAIMANLLASSKPGMAGLQTDQQIQFITFTTRWGQMHPIEAVERYQAELAKKPNDADLHLGYGKLRRFLGYTDEAQAEFERTLSIDPENIEAWVDLAQMASARRDRAEAIRCWEKTRLISKKRAGASPEDALYGVVADQHLDLLRSGIFPESPSLIASPEEMEEEPQPQQRATPETRTIKVGRNDPCPCGSGKKYKHCHGRE